MRETETFEQKPREVLPNTGTLPIDRAFALIQVLGRFDLPCRLVANEGAKYPDGDSRVPRGEVFLTYDTGDIPAEVIWGMVDEIVPIPMVDGKR